MQKKLNLIALFLCFGLISFSYPNKEKTNSTITNKISEHIAFILFRLVEDEIRMEKYDAHELNPKITNVSKEESDMHLVMTLDLRENDLTPKSMAWDREIDGKINISTTNTDYTMPLEAIFKDTEEEVIAICFDCKINHQEEKSHINIILPIKIEEAKIAFVFEDITKAACGFFMTNKDFEDLLAISGKLTTKDALDTGLIYSLCKKTAIETNKKQPETTESGKVTFSSKLTNGAFYIKNFVLAKMIAIKNLLGNTYNSVFKKNK